MTVKLTLTVDEMVVKKAKAYAQKNGTSVSKIVTEVLLEKMGSEKKITAKTAYWKENISQEVLDILPKRSLKIPAEWAGKTDKEIFSMERENRSKNKSR